MKLFLVPFGILLALLVLASLFTSRSKPEISPGWIDAGDAWESFRVYYPSNRIEDHGQILRDEISTAIVNIEYGIVDHDLVLSGTHIDTGSGYRIEGATYQLVRVHGTDRVGIRIIK